MILHTNDIIAKNPYAAILFKPPVYPHKSTFYKITVFYGGVSKMDFYSRKGGPIKTVTMKSGDAFIITPLDAHYFNVVDKKDYCFRDIYIFEEDIRSICDSVSSTLFDKITSDEYPPIFNLTQNSMIAYSEIHSILVYKQRSEKLDIMHRVGVIYLLGLYIQNDMNDENIYPCWLRTLLCRLYDEAFIVKPIEEISSTTYFSHGYCCRQFKHYLNMPLKQYVIKRKLAYSCSILISSEESIETIATRLNFSTRSNYIKLFKREYGVTPNKYRKGRKH